MLLRANSQKFWVQFLEYFLVFLINVLPPYRSTQWHSSLRHCATSRKVTGLIPDGVIGIFHSHNSSGRTMTLGLTQTLTNDYQEYFLGGGPQGGQYVGLTPLVHLCVNCLQI